MKYHPDKNRTKPNIGWSALGDAQPARGLPNVGAATLTAPAHYAPQFRITVSHPATPSTQTPQHGLGPRLNLLPLPRFQLTYNLPCRQHSPFRSTVLLFHKVVEAYNVLTDDKAKVCFPILGLHICLGKSCAFHLRAWWRGCSVCGEFQRYLPLSHHIF